MRMIRTDLAMEAHACWKESAGETSELKGVIAREETLRGFPLTRVEIVDNEGAAALQKPQGTYLTLDVSRCQGPEGLQEAAGAVAELLEPLLPEEGPALVAGLGNPAMTPDALGPRCMDHLLITRHLKNVLPQLRETAALSGGVLGTTGLEAAEWVRGVAEHMKPAAVIVVDALAARSLDRLCQSVQLSDTGLVPGSGVGNHRMALNRETLGLYIFTKFLYTPFRNSPFLRRLRRRHIFHHIIYSFSKSIRHNYIRISEQYQPFLINRYNMCSKQIA